MQTAHEKACERMRAIIGSPYHERYDIDAIVNAVYAPTDDGLALTKTGDELWEVINMHMLFGGPATERPMRLDAALDNWLSQFYTEDRIAELACKPRSEMDAALQVLAQSTLPRRRKIMTDCIVLHVLAHNSLASSTQLRAEMDEHFTRWQLGSIGEHAWFEERKLQSK